VLIVRPDSGNPGAPVLVTGQDFPANTSIVVDLGLDGVGTLYPAFATDSSNGRGIFRATFTLPMDWSSGTAALPGRVTITARTADGSAQTTAFFDLQP
jgi:hypothetical protein